VVFKEPVMHFWVLSTLAILVCDRVFSRFMGFLIPGQDFSLDVAQTTSHLDFAMMTMSLF